MAELYQQERLQPSLLDRLTDNSYLVKKNTLTAKHNEASSKIELDSQKLEKSLSKQSDVLDRQGITARQLREIVKRDLGWLLNTGSLDDVEDLTDYPYTAQSVLNYGIPDLTGVTVANANIRDIERRLQRAILRYEPRILKKTLQINVVKSDEMSRHALQFEIECDIWGQHSPEHLILKSEIDLETGSVVVIDRSGG